MATNRGRLLYILEGYLCAHLVVSCCDRLVFQDYFSNIRDIMIEKQQNQARDVFCHAFALNWQLFMVCERAHTHLIVFTHACGYYSRPATISLAELQVRLLFEGGYYSGCGIYLNKYSMSIQTFNNAMLRLVLDVRTQWTIISSRRKHDRRHPWLGSAAVFRL